MADSYKTIDENIEIALRERGSKFLAFGYPVQNEEQIKEHLDALRKEYYNATHHCYAWRLGLGEGARERDNDDGEPPGTAGKPILGQILSNELTDILVVVVRYFGGTKLGVPGLIKAYKDSAKEVVDSARIVEKIIEVFIDVEFEYEYTNEVMRVVNDMEPRIAAQQFDTKSRLKLAIRASAAEELQGRLESIYGIKVERISTDDDNEK